MADDNTLRSYRPNDPFRRDVATAGERDRSSDPLVELARLIGQSDPFAEFGRGSARESTVRRETPASADVPNWRGTPPPYALMRARTATPAPPSQPPISASMVDYAEPHRYAAQPLPTQPHHDDVEQIPAVEDAAYDDVNYAAAAQDGPAHEGSYYEDSATVEQQDEAAYDDPPRPRRRSGMLTALTLIGCAMVGTAGAYGYRNYYAGPHPTSSTPVIVADKTPTKVVLASDPQSSKTIQDRVGDGVVAERMVPREEQPVILKVPTPPATESAPALPLAPASTAAFDTFAIASSPTIVQAPPPATFQAPPPPPLIAPPASTAASEPKRVRTVTIRSDGADGGRSTGTTAPRGAAPKGARGAPLQLDPQQLSDPAPLTPPAPRVASIPAGGSGGYIVQVSSQKSQAEAQASFRVMQAKYPSVFSGQAPIIRRADLGAKGVFYRALVGPFPNSGDAGVFCSRLKAAGGQCIVQKN